ncbi:MAG: hypothetical protein BGN96_14235 [Bacteroidales bacterium 45-6]|nr:MAG: hypothetical protein BGN96_14235 [Bacteroidales bacterium 45-6]
MASNINQAIFKLVKRAEKQDIKHLIETFVDVGPLFTLLQNKDHQIIYGRRGTGKTHALTYLINHLQSEGHVPAYIDMRNIGSNGGIYSDLNLPITERATRLLIDTYSVVHDQILDYVLSNDESCDLSKYGPLLDELARSISEIEVVGQIEIEQSTNETNIEKNEFDLTASLKDVSFGNRSENSQSQVSTSRSKAVGNSRHRVHFTTVNNIFSRLKILMGSKELWILIDEWAEVPLDLQPFLADLFRRTLFSIRGITVKIAAIEKRTNLKITVNTNYIGIETGADISSSLNLDEFMVFDNDQKKSRDFYQQLIYKHVNQLLSEEGANFPNKEAFTNAAFTQILALEELVRASEGVPRDAINILIHSAIKADNDKISIPHIRTAAKKWYTTDKEKAVSARPKAKFLLRWIIDEVIGLRIGDSMKKEIYVTWAVDSEPSWGEDSLSNDLAVRDFCCNFALWFQSKFNTTVKDIGHIGNAESICSLRSIDDTYVVSFGVNFGEASEIDIEVTKEHRKLLTAFLKRFRFDP